MHEITVQRQRLAEHGEEWKGRRLGAEAAVFDQNAAMRHSRRQRLKDRPADRVEYHADTFRSHNLLQSGFQVFFRRRDYMNCAEVEQRLSLG
ncbi:hypothetical protein D9M72_649910 [compost metagenome]